MAMAPIRVSCLFSSYVLFFLQEREKENLNGMEYYDEEIPMIDLDPFSHAEQYGDEGRKEVIRKIGKACEEWGFFQVVNHGIPVELIEEALNICRVFFDYPEEEKRKVKGDCRLPPGAKRLPTGYNVYPPGSWDLYENLYYTAHKSESSDFSDGNSRCNAFPEDLPQLRFVIEKLLEHLGKTTEFIESLISQSLGLSRDFLKEINRDKVEPLKVLCYPKATTPNEIGARQHQDSSCITLVGQDDTGGYQVLKDGHWVDIRPTRGALVINVGDILQVWSNNRFKSAFHRVLNNEQRRRCSFAFATVPSPEKLVTPLPQFTDEADRPPAYRPFMFRDYMVKRVENKMHPPTRAEDFADITIYAI